MTSSNALFFGLFEHKVEYKWLNHYKYLKKSEEENFHKWKRQPIDVLAG